MAERQSKTTANTTLLLFLASEVEMKSGRAGKGGSQPLNSYLELKQAVIQWSEYTVRVG